MRGADVLVRDRLADFGACVAADPAPAVSGSAASSLERHPKSHSLLRYSHLGSFPLRPQSYLGCILAEARSQTSVAVRLAPSTQARRPRHARCSCRTRAGLTSPTSCAGPHAAVHCCPAPPVASLAHMAAAAGPHGYQLNASTQRPQVSSYWDWPRVRRRASPATCHVARCTRARSRRRPAPLGPFCLRMRRK
jgi:hypothetical protein